MLGYKGFDKKFQCRGFQYEVGKTFTFDGEIKVCECGFHFHTNPLGVFEFYPPTNSRFALVEATGNIKVDDFNPSKQCTDEITIVKELSLEELLAHTGRIISNLQNTPHSVAVDANSYSTACTTAPESAAINYGRHSIAVAGDSCSVAIVTADNSIAVATGRGSIAKGALGCWLVLAEWDNDGIADVQVFKVDGVKIKPDTFYSLKDGLPVEVD